MVVVVESVTSLVWVSFLASFLLGFEGQFLKPCMPTAEGHVRRTPCARGVGGSHRALRHLKERVGRGVGKMAHDDFDTNKVRVAEELSDFIVVMKDAGKERDPVTGR